MATKFAEELLTSMDSDSSGSVDSAEFSSAALALSSSSDTSSVSKAFSALDANQDGVVSIDELTSSISSILGQQQGTMAAGGPPPPPPPRKGEDTGYTQDELTAMSSETSSTDSKLSSLFETLAKNFSSADTNGDGKVTSAEAQAYQEATKQSSVGTTASNSEDGLMKKLMEQIIAQYANKNSVSSSAINLSA